MPRSPAESAAGATAASDFEFIEFLNTGTSPLDLTGVRLTGAVQEFNFSNGGSATLTLNPGSRVILCGHLAAFRARYGANARVAGAFNGNLNNGGETITLLDRLGEIIWSFRYNDKSPWPQPDGSGRSIVLTNAAQHPAPDPALGQHWKPSAAGGNPGEAGTLPFTLTAGDDDDQDGLPNLVEYAFGTDPADPASHRTMSITAQPASPGFSPSFTISIPTGLLADGYTATIQSSPDLRNWTSPMPPPLPQGIIVSPAGTAAALWTLPAATAPPTAPQFLRVLISKP